MTKFKSTIAEAWPAVSVQFVAELAVHLVLPNWPPRDEPVIREELGALSGTELHRLFELGQSRSDVHWRNDDYGHPMIDVRAVARGVEYGDIGRVLQNQMRTT